ncbi:MAG: DUF488 family protein [Kiritimatiellae bacterium]|nr:DUF488 family protein [Kiritimatiellia bacterium]
MYYRRKILMALLQMFSGELDKLTLQKLLFLVTTYQNKKSYDFVPYKYGCFSFQANADLCTLMKYNLVSETETSWKYIGDEDYLNTLKEKDRSIIEYIKSQYGSLSTDELIRFTYNKYPYYAINSTIAKKLLSEEELKQVEEQKTVGSETVLFTIGYEGISLESCINRLLANDIKLLCDVRKNSFSMKYGFSKSQLSKACNGVGIKFIHIPEVGINADKRRALNSQADYDKLFDEYKQTVLVEASEEQNEILSLLKKEKRIALTCFEANINQCHRKHLAESISKLQRFNYKLRHI